MVASWFHWHGSLSSSSGEGGGQMFCAHPWRGFDIMFQSFLIPILKILKRKTQKFHLGLRIEISLSLKRMAKNAPCSERLGHHVLRKDQKRENRSPASAPSLHTPPFGRCQTGSAPRPPMEIHGNPHGWKTHCIPHKLSVVLSISPYFSCWIS